MNWNVAQRDPAQLGLETLPGTERDDEVGALVVQRLVGGGVERDDVELARPAVGPDDRLERGDLVGVAEAGIHLAVELLRPGDRRGLEHGDLLGRVLEDGHRGDDRRPGGGRERQRVLEADPALGLPGGDDRLGRRAAVRQHVQLHARLLVPALGLRDEEPEVVRVRRPVEREADLRGLGGCRRGSRRPADGDCAAVAARGRSRRCARPAARGDEQHQARGRWRGWGAAGSSRTRRCLQGKEIAASGDRGRRRRERACFLHRYEPDQVPRVCGLHHTLSALGRSPEAIFGCRPSLHRDRRRSLLGVIGMRRGGHRGRRHGGRARHRGPGRPAPRSRRRPRPGRARARARGGTRGGGRRGTWRVTLPMPSNTSLACVGTIGSAEPWNTYVGTGIASIAASTAFDPVLLLERLRAEPDGGRRRRERVRCPPSRAPPGPGTGRHPAARSRCAAWARRPRAPRPASASTPAMSSSRPGALRTSRSGSGRSRPERTYPHAMSPPSEWP